MHMPIVEIDASMDDSMNPRARSVVLSNFRHLRGRQREREGGEGERKKNF